LDSTVGFRLAAVAPRRSPLKIGMAAGLAVETAIVGVASFAVISDGLGVAGLGQGAGAGAGAWAPVAVDFLALAFLGAIGFTATWALWEHGWGRGSLVGPVKRSAVWAAMFAHVLVAAHLLIPGAFGPLTSGPRRAGAITDAMVLVLIAIGIGLVLRGNPYRDVGLRVVAVLAISMVAAFGAAQASSRYATHLVINASFAMAEVPTPDRIYAASAIVCQGSVTEACANRAADLGGYPVAWIPLQPGPKVVVLDLHGIGYASEQRFLLTEGVSLRSGGAFTLSGTPDRRIVRGAVTAQVRVEHADRGGSVRIDWTRQGQHYMLTEVWSSGTVDRARIDQAVGLWRSVRYAVPGAGSN